MSFLTQHFFTDVKRLLFQHVLNISLKRTMHFCWFSNNREWNWQAPACLWYVKCLLVLSIVLVRIFYQSRWSICLSASVFLSVCLPLSVCLSVCRSVFFSQYACLSMGLSVCRSVSVFLSVCRSVCLRLSACLIVCTVSVSVCLCRSLTLSKKKVSANVSSRINIFQLVD